ncbi:PA2778 family cysteine peptidase [Halomonas caseinilytica]|uniref:Tetratricopeptide repeat-containing protein n=1 Tax=Halomonas caseinilytica TaxID=438744 RepID=A0A1M6U8N1_9GAMM|nr:PA2778 family cysteine peptidase [Halomonas caseinilytica]SEM94970.1 TPR repeat-containing protein [Halomonas caseinilytica]SHK65602.1 Tetratricopeptide repeat-containing protein [Halomonas caseinilytica]
MNRLLRQPGNARFAGVFALACLLLVLTGCASTPTLSPEAARVLPQRTLIDDVPFHAQRDYQCGPASLAMALGASGVSVDVDTLIPQVFLPGRKGSVQPEMLATIRRHGRIPFPLEGGFEALLAELDANHPVVVMQNLSLPVWPVWHYAVAIGYDRPAEELILHSGTTAKRRVTFDRFDATWARSERWGFIALAPGELPASGDADSAIRAITDFESAQGAQAALPAWNALAERYPDSAMTHFALGNARHATGDTNGAIAAFRAATRADTELAPAWLNLGLLLKGRDDIEPARHAFEQAAMLPGPWQSRAREELASLEQDRRAYREL